MSEQHPFRISAKDEGRKHSSHQQLGAVSFSDYLRCKQSELHKKFSNLHKEAEVPADPGPRRKF